MGSRLRKNINTQRRMAYAEAAKEYNARNKAVCYTDENPCDNKKLPFPKKLLAGHQHQHTTPSHSSVRSSTRVYGPIIADLKKVDWGLCHEYLWVRIFDKQDRLLFNHVDEQPMYASQIVSLCTRLVNHLNLISQTDELNVQNALGTLEGTIIAQLTPKPYGQVQHHAWNLQQPIGIHYDVGAIAIIKQTKDEIFTGQLIDSGLETTFQLQ